MRALIPAGAWRALQPLRFGAVFGRSYDAPRYWRHRLRAYGFTLRGVGHVGMTEAANEAMYEAAAATLRTVCATAGVKLGEARVLDVGCGTGFYAEVCRAAGCASYVGADITDVLFAAMRARYPGYRFVRRDAGREPLPGSHDLVLLIDVTQHVTDARRFDYLIGNVAARVRSGGVLVFTSWLDAWKRETFYERSRTLGAYTAALPGWRLADPVPFRDKWMVAAHKPESSRRG